MMLTTPFDAMTPNETDYRAFDFTMDVASDTIQSVSWLMTCHPPGQDQQPMQRVLGSQIATRIYVRNPADGTLTMRQGYFVIATVGNMPSKAAGATYTLSAVATMSPSGRVLELSASLPCQAG